MESHIETPSFDFSAAFDRMSHSGLLFKLKSIGVGGNVPSICREFLSNRRQRVIVDDATSECITIVFGVPQGSVLGPLLFILYTSEMFELVENRLYAYADDSTLLASQFASQQTESDRPAVAASLNRDLARIQEWCNHWRMILNHNKTKVLVVIRSRTVNPPHGNLVLSGVSICASPNLDNLGVKFNSRPTFVCLLCLSKNWYFEVCEACLVGHFCVDSLLLCNCSPNP